MEIKLIPTAYAQGNLSNKKNIPGKISEPYFIKRFKDFINADAGVCTGDLYVLGPNRVFKGALEMQSVTQVLDASEMERLNIGLVRKYKITFFVSGARLVRSIDPRTGDASEWQPFASLVPQVPQEEAEAYLAQAAALQQAMNSYGKMFGKNQMIGDGFSFDPRLANALVAWELRISEYSDQKYHVDDIKLSNTSMLRGKKNNTYIDLITNFLSTKYPVQKMSCSDYDWVEKNKRRIFFDIDIDKFTAMQKEINAEFNSLVESPRFAKIKNIIKYNSGDINEFSNDYIDKADLDLLAEYRDERKALQETLDQNKIAGLFKEELDIIDRERTSAMDDLFYNLSLKKITLREYIAMMRVQQKLNVSKKVAILMPLTDASKIIAAEKTK